MDASLDFNLPLIVSDQMRGRVMSVFDLALRLGFPVGSLTLGKIIPIVGVAPALPGTGLALIGFALYFVIAMRKPLFSRDPCANPFEGPRGWSRTQQFAARRHRLSPIRDGSLPESEEQGLALFYLL